MDAPQNDIDALSHGEKLALTTDIVSAFVSNNSVQTEDLQNLIQSTFQTLSTLSEGTETGPTHQKPAVPIKKSITDDYIICLEDGKQLKMLKRYLRTQYNMSPEEYRRKWGLPADYPMVAPNYAKRRSQFAKNSGLGKNGGRKATKKTTKKAARKKA